MNKKSAPLVVTLILLWVTVGGLKVLFENPAILHTILAVTLVFAGALILKYYGRDPNIAVTAPFQKSNSRVGYRLAMGYFIATSLLYMAFNPNTWQFELPNTINATFTNSFSALAVLASPVYEEFFFRGCLQPSLHRILESKLPNAKASLWSIYLGSLIFWLFHAPISLSTWQDALSHAAIPLSPGSFFLGLVCGFIVHKDASIWFAIAFHAFANLMGPVWAGILPAAAMPFFFSAG